MFKKVLFLICFSLWCVGCAGTATTEPQKISFMFFGDPAERTAYLTLVDAFEAKHPEIEVETIHIPSQSDYRTRLATDFAAGNPASVTLMNYRRYAAFAAKGLLEPVQPFLENSTLINRKDFYPITIEAFTWQGNIICIPQNISSLVVYYNQDLFDAAGIAYPTDDWSWQQFLETAQTLTKDSNNDGTVDQYGLGLEPSLFRLAPFVWQNGGVIVDDELHPARLTMTRFPTQEALRWFVELQTVHHVVPNRVEEESLESEDRFVAGMTAMYLNSRRGTPSYREITSFSWDIAPLPVGKERAGILHSDAYCMSAGMSDAADQAAWTFIEFANSVEGQTIIAQSGRTVPSLIAVAESEAFLDPTHPPARSRVFLDTIPDLRRVPTLSSWGEIESIAGEEVERAFYGDISVEEAGQLALQRTEEYFLLGINADTAP